MAMKVGFIGLGRMGEGMALNLVKDGHEVTVYNRTRAKVERLAAQGARPAAAIEEACRGEAVITMLADVTVPSRASSMAMAASSPVSAGAPFMSRPAPSAPPCRSA
jgi:3-hydroxyisobutyrate dehydrogenase-like beta-hydroxyacid dehydrogenase